MRLSVQVRDGFRLLQMGPDGWTEEAARLYTDERCDGVWLTSDRPFADLGFLRPLPGLRAVVFGAAAVKDTSALFDKTDLEELGIGLNVRDLRGLSRLRSLRVLAVPFRKGVAEIAELTGLETLAVEEWPKGTDLDLLGPKPQLRDLYLQLKRTAMVSSSWFPSAPALTQLSLYFGRLSDTAGLAALTEMESLRFADTKVSNLDFVTSMPRLSRLELDNAGEIASLAPLRGHPSLTELYVIGSTQIRDGNLDIQADVPNLRSGSIANRPL